MIKVPIDTTRLFRPLDIKLHELLQSLTPAEWSLPTVARLWNVKDVAAHLLDTNIRTIAQRDGHAGPAPAAPIHSFSDLVAFLNQLNAGWVDAMKRVSPAVLMQWLASTGDSFCTIMENARLEGPAPVAVAWAGEEQSPNWFHIAREYTEKWHHQQQVRDATRRPGIMNDTFYYPVLDTFMMALPYTYRHAIAPYDTVVQITITGSGGGHWFLVRHDNWVLSKTNSLAVTARTIIDGAAAWKLFTKSGRKNDIINYIKTEGDIALAEVVLDMIAVMA